jgi:hypothetical protein
VQAYVRERLLGFATRDPTFAQLLGVELRVVEQAVAAAFAQRAAREAANSSDRQLALVLSHDCMCALAAAGDRQHSRACSPCRTEVPGVVDSSVLPQVVMVLRAW